MKKRHTDQMVVQQDMDTLYIGNLNTVEFDLTLPEKGIHGSAITWQSGHDVFLTNEGKIRRPPYGMGDRVIPLTAVFRYGEAVGEKVYEVRILEEENKLQVFRVYPVKKRIQTGVKGYLPQAAIVDTMDGDTISHPVVWDSGSEICFCDPGEYLLEGKLAGTTISVVAEVSAVEEKTEKILNIRPKVKECSEAQIRLLEGSEFYDAQERMKAFLLAVDDDRMLYNFRSASGLDTQGAACMDGWDSPDSQIRGHTTGHYMSALALCYKATGDWKIKEKAEYMIREMAKCQQAFAQREGIREGFLSGYSEEQFDLLEEYTHYPTIWAPYYTLHKIFAGLLDCYRFIRSDTALLIADKLGMWVWRRLSRLPHEQLTGMWSMYIAGEFGGMNAVMAELYELTGKEEFLQCAKLFDNDKLFYPMEQKKDALSTMHANQHIPQILGAMEIFKATGEKKYFDIADFFWETVTGYHSYAAGGMGEGEMFHESGKIGALLTKNTEETCATYNMLKLTKELYRYHSDSRYMDYYENAVVNHILASQDKRITGESTYFFPLGPGMKKEFLCENSCCHGTGMESHFKYREGIYYEDGESIYVNLFLPSEMVWEDRGIYVRLDIDHSRPEQMKLFVKGCGLHSVKIRKPLWAEEYRIKVEGKKAEIRPDEKGYLQIRKDFSNGIQVQIEFPYHFRIMRTPDDKQKAAVKFGPYVLAAISDEKEFLNVSFSESDIEKKMIRIGDDIAFFCDGMRWIPLCKIGEEAYHVYVLCRQECVE